MPKKKKKGLDIPKDRKVNIEYYFRVHPEKNEYIKTLMEETFKGQSMTLDDWNKSKKELLSKNY